uniref:Uncharacterized protein n=1 Tax=Glossina palpalis gambiensis TaxID=67801 RepID=A0A1B0B1Y7_9MUSC
IAHAAPNRNHDFSAGDKRFCSNKSPRWLIKADSMRNVFCAACSSVRKPNNQRAMVLRASNLQRVSDGNSSCSHHSPSGNLQSRISGTPCISNSLTIRRAIIFLIVRSRTINSKSSDSQTILNSRLAVSTIAITTSYRTFSSESCWRARKHSLISGRK